jgi:predicted ATPase
MEFSQLNIAGHRRLFDVRLRLKPLTVLIGPNGVGKTSLLEVWRILSRAASGDLANAVSEFGGLSEILTRDHAQQWKVELTADVPSRAPLVYSLTLAPQAQWYEITQESLTQQNDPTSLLSHKHIKALRGDVRYYNPEKRKLEPPSWAHNTQETALSQVPKMFPEPEEFRRTLANCSAYGPLDVSPRAPVRLPQPFRPADTPGSNGELLAACLYGMRETDRSRFEMIEDTLVAAFPDFERLEFPPVAAGSLTLAWKDRRFSRSLFVNQLSEGTLRFIWLTTLLSTGTPSAITLLDEPEVSLHPQLLNLLVDLLRQASTRTHLIVATHADRLVKSLNPSEVLIADTEDGLAKFTWGDDLDLDAWLADYSLDELWQMGRLGGRP